MMRRAIWVGAVILAAALLAAPNAAIVQDYCRADLTGESLVDTAGDARLAPEDSAGWLCSEAAALRSLSPPRVTVLPLHPSGAGRLRSGTVARPYHPPRIARPASA